MPAVEVRPATLADWPTVRSIRLRALADAPDAFASTLEREAAFDDAEWQRRVAPGNWVLALAEDDVVGVAAGIQERGRPDDDRHLVAMWVAPEFRGRHVADRLVAAVADWARSNGAVTLSLWVAAGNDRARRCYLRLGFEASGERQPLPNRPDVTEERMAKPISPTAAA
jgi:GNAT superfamily N-acetyltransferase